MVASVAAVSERLPRKAGSQERKAGRFHVGEGREMRGWGAILVSRRIRWQRLQLTPDCGIFCEVHSVMCIGVIVIAGFGSRFSYVRRSAVSMARSIVAQGAIWKCWPGCRVSTSVRVRPSPSTAIDVIWGGLSYFVLHGPASFASTKIEQTLDGSISSIDPGAWEAASCSGNFRLHQLPSMFRKW